MTNYSWAENTLGTLLNQKNNGKYSKNRETVIRQPPDFLKRFYWTTHSLYSFDCECLL